MSLNMNVFLFGDQANEYNNNLRGKLHQKHMPALTSFLEQANAALKDEVALQPGLIRKTIPNFSTLLDLVDWLDESKVSNPAIESAICTISQIACFIRWVKTTLVRDGY